MNASDGLRHWAKGIYPLEAGIELLLRAFGGRFARPGYPWVQPTDDGSYYLDVDQLTEDTIGGLSGGEQRVLRIAASLLGGSPVSLHEEIPGVDREHVVLVLAAIAHAAGSHEHAGDLVADLQGRYISNGIRMSFARLGSLYPWPESV